MAVAQPWIETYNDDCLRCHEVDALDCEVMRMSTGQAVRGLENLRVAEVAHKPPEAASTSKNTGTEA